MNVRLADLEEVVRAAGRLALSFRHKLEVHRKPDGTVVTQADVAVEKFLHENLGALAPDAGFLGEENTSTNLQGQQQLWVVDPID
nr:inositol monophosphatase family protein [bacterium]